MPKGCAGHVTSLTGGFCRLQVCSFTLIHVLGQPVVLGLARLAPLPLPPRCQEVSENGQGGNEAWGSREYPSWALNSIHLHAAAPELLEAALGRGATDWEWSALQASRQGAGGGGMGPPDPSVLAAESMMVKERGPCVHVDVSAAAEHWRQEKPCLSYSSYKALLGHCQFLV